MATDPVCGMYVDERTARLRLVRENRAYYFCSSGCLEQFAEPARQTRRLLRKLSVAWPLSAVVVLLTYGWHPADWPIFAFLLATVVQFYSGSSFYRGAWDGIRERIGNMDLLIAVGTTAAYLYSAAALLLPGRLPPAYYFDASALIVALILTGNYLEHLTRERATSALRRLRELLPARGRVLRDGQVIEIPLEDIRAGDLLRIRPGERFPTDAVVRNGRTSVDEALLTGESAGATKQSGDVVLSGSVNGEGLVDVEATKVGADTFLSEIGHLMSEAETARVPLQQLADRIAGTFVPLVLALAAIAAVGWFVLGGASFTVAVLVFVSVAITACPCAFGIATPAAIVVGTARAAEEGVLFKGHDSLERTAVVDIVLTDKTGTLTSGEPVLSEVVSIDATDDQYVVALAAGLEAGSEHPLARAVAAYSRSRSITPELIVDIRSDPGRGVVGSHNAKPVAILRGDFARKEGYSLEAIRTAIDRAEAAGSTWSVVVDGSQVLGLLAFSSPASSGTIEAVQALRSEGVDIVMVTGDNERAARSLASTVGIRNVRAQVTPGEKIAIVQEYRAAGHRVAFVGDGINDAPALAAADVGIAIGAGTDVAREAGQVILIGSDFRGVPLALRTARATIRKVRQNLFWAIGFNAVLLPIAAGALVPVFGFGIYDSLPIVGALAMAFSSTTVVLNSLSLRWIRWNAATPRAARYLVETPRAA